MKSVLEFDSITYTPLSDKLWNDLARRNINSIGTKRNSIKELRITNYGVA